MSHNTKTNKTDTNFYCGYCGKWLLRSDFSPNCTRNVCRKHSTMYDNYRAYQLKQNIISHLGGCCNKCGYNKNPAALDLHHPNPSIKERSWDALRKHKLEYIIKHVQEQGIILLCSNCHREMHNNTIPIKLTYISQSPKTDD